MITKGLISPDTAGTLVHRYLTTLDPFLYGIASHLKDLDSVRKASPTLLAAICAVAALHKVEDKDVFEICNKEYRHLVASSLFEKRNLEYLRALCIGSFWLLNASRILSSDAVRRAADVRLHRHFYRLTDTTSAKTSEQQFEVRDRVRLWYLLFICDQHLSILHNRDCLTRQEQDIIEQRDNFLVGDNVARQDVRIISQVSLLRVMGQIRDVFGAETTTPLPKAMAVQLTHFLRELDQWYAQFLPLFGEYLPARYARTHLTPTRSRSQYRRVPSHGTLHALPIRQTLSLPPRLPKARERPDTHALHPLCYRSIPSRDHDLHHDLGERCIPQQPGWCAPLLPHHDLFRRPVPARSVHEAQGSAQH